MSPFISETLFDDDIGRVTYASRVFPTPSVISNVFRYGGVGTLAVNYLAESGVKEIKAYPTTAGWDLGFDRFGRAKRTYWINSVSGATYADLRVSHDENSNITAAENAWVTPWSATYESDGLNRLKSLDSGVMASGSIPTPVRTEDWKTRAGP